MFPERQKGKIKEKRKEKGDRKQHVNISSTTNTYDGSKSVNSGDGAGGEKRHKGNSDSLTNSTCDQTPFKTPPKKA